MKYAGMPQGMWLLYKKSFERNLVSVLGFDKETSKAVTQKAAPKYRQIIAKLPEFEKADRFKMNLVNCAVLIAFLLNMEKKPTIYSQ